MKVPLGKYLIRLLESHDVDVVFGIPGVHTIELYRGLEGSSITHVTPRHEQGAGFMADGYARMSGKPGVCLVITGPGFSNISTAMLQALADSIPMLVITSVNDPDRSTRGNLHEMPDQAAFACTVACDSYTVSCIDELTNAVHAAFLRFATARPGPVHIEIPLSLMFEDCHREFDTIGATPSNLIPEPPGEAEVLAAVDAIKRAESVVILAGGGVREAGRELIQLAEKLNALIVTTANARSYVSQHPLVVHASASLKPLRSLIESADVVIAVGTELGPTDYDVFDTDGPLALKKLIQIDIDETQLDVNQSADIRLCCSAVDGITSLLPKLTTNDATQSKLSISDAIQNELSDEYKRYIGLLEKLRDAIEDAVFVGDSTQLIYAGNLAFVPGDKGAWFNSAVGFGTLGYGLSAAIGAKLGQRDKPVICLIGDGGLQFSLAELGTLTDSGVSVVIIVWNNDGYGEIRETMKAKGVSPLGVDLQPPDFCKIADAYGIDAQKVDNAEDLVSLTTQAAAEDRTILIEAMVNEQFRY